MANKGCEIRKDLIKIFKQILKFIEEKKVVSLQDLAEHLEKDVSIISDSIKLLAIKGYLKNLNCCITEKDFKFKCINCSQRFQCHVNPVSMYEITEKGTQYYQKEVDE